ncbi:S-adenosyl-L-methionine-dependent methyltransferase [Xylariales sp. PMI_506]|nr:S-adenosyl-L-methionine-dependent methyltransferase [Xylariales sp. PMI_506]
MPRLPPSLFRQAHGISPHLRTLLPACRDLRSAQNELRWIREHVSSTPALTAQRSQRGSRRRAGDEQEKAVARLCARRGRRGEPLQYVLGSQPFGPLDIRCRRGVLIPRPETEAYVAHLAERLLAPRDLGGPGLLPASTTSEKTGAQEASPRLSVVDFCTGTGCIPLLLFALLSRRLPGTLAVRGFDIDRIAVGLAEENLRHNVRRGSIPAAAVAERRLLFQQADIFSDDWVIQLEREVERPDILISNPPYISARGFNHETGRSVRNHEPKLALVPEAATFAVTAGCEPEDAFYARLLQVARKLRPRVMLFEVGDLDQALRVVQLVVARIEKLDHMVIEVWRDWPDMTPENNETAEAVVSGRVVPIRGSGHGRSVLVYRKY